VRGDASRRRSHRLTTMSKMLRAIALAAVAVAAAEFLHLVDVRAAGAQAAPRPTASVQASPRPLLDQYCVSCHNDKLKTGGLTLERVDPSAVAGHEEMLEKVVRKLRSGLMPPEGRPRPDAASIAAFAASLESALDRNAAAAPNPGRVAWHRLNRAEYVNVVHDLLALDVDGTATSRPRRKSAVSPLPARTTVRSRRSTKWNSARGRTHG